MEDAKYPVFICELAGVGKWKRIGREPADLSGARFEQTENALVVNLGETLERGWRPE
jgi:hypothetical protein